MKPLSELAYDSIRAGAPGLSDATCKVIAASIARKAQAAPARRPMEDLGDGVWADVDPACLAAPADPVAGVGEPVAWRWRSDLWSGDGWRYTATRPDPKGYLGKVTVEPLYAALSPSPGVTDKLVAKRLTEGEKNRIRAALYMVGNPSAWDDYDEGASETIRDLCSMIEALAAARQTEEGA